MNTDFLNYLYAYYCCHEHLQGELPIKRKPFYSSVKICVICG